MPSYQDITLAFENLPEKAPLCKLFVDVYCRNFENEMDDEKECSAKGMVPMTFFDAVVWRHTHARKMMVKGEMEIGYRLKLADYHEHQSQEEASKCYCKLAR